MKTHIKPTVRDGYPKFLLDIRYADGRRERHLFDSRREAEIEETALKTKLAISGEVWTALSAREQSEVLFAIHEAQEMGVSVREVVEFYRHHRAKKHKAVPLQQVIHETLQAAKAQTDRPRYIESLEWVLNKFAKGREQMPITRISLADIESFLASQRGRDGVSPAATTTIIGLRAKLFPLFAEAVRREYIEEAANPMRRVICPKHAMVRQRFFVRQEGHDLLWVCRQTDKPFLGWLAIGMFAGIRPEELEKLEWRCVDMDRGEIVIDEHVSKTRRRRIIRMEDCGPLKEWLLEADRSHRWVVPCDTERGDRKMMKRIQQFVTRHRSRLCERAGVTWHQDIPRKTACTYLLALHESEDKVALILGNSPKIMHQHYRGLCRREDMLAFMALTPTTVKNDPIALPEGGQGKKAEGKLIP